MRETGKMANFDPKKFLSDNAIIIMIAGSHCRFCYR